MHHPTDRITHTTAFVTQVVAEREIVQWVHPMKDRSDDPSHHHDGREKPGTSMFCLLRGFVFLISTHKLIIIIIIIIIMIIMIIIIIIFKNNKNSCLRSYHV